MAMWLKRFVLPQADNSHRNVVLARRSTAKKFLPLRFAPAGDLIARPLGPFKSVKVLRCGLHYQATFISVE
jgi:hypothetical protein